MTGGRYANRIAVLGLVAITGYVVALGYLMQHSTYDMWGALVIAPVLVLVSLPVLRWAVRSADQPWLFTWALVAMLVKLAASIARYYMAFVFYGGSADAARYNGVGRQLSELYRQGIFSDTIRSGGAGTKFIESVTGAIYTVTGPSLLGGYLVYSWIGFWGLLCAYLAFRTALPEGFSKRYALMVFFLPTLLFWPSGIGKEAWMMLGVGLFMWGAARLMSRLRGGLPLLVAGAVVTGVVRPHVTALLTIAVVVAYLLRRSSRVTQLTPVVKIGGFVLLLVATYVVIRVTASFLGVEDLSRDGFETALQDAQDRTAQGGSEFSGAAVTSPLGIPLAVVTVLFRPFPWESGSLQELLASAEGVFLLYLTWRFRASLVSAFRSLRSAPFVTFCLTYTLGYVLVFAGFSNFGILVRQRSLVIPAFLVLLAVPLYQRVRTGSEPQPELVAR